MAKTSWNAHKDLSGRHLGRHVLHSFFKVTTCEPRSSSGEFRPSALELPRWLHFPLIQGAMSMAFTHQCPQKSTATRPHGTATVKSITCFQTLRESEREKERERQRKAKAALHVYCAAMKTKSIMYCLNHLLGLYLFVFFLEVTMYNVFL